ncbi:TonB-dependent receptor [Hymenobacter qilianensis]|uniref:TonB-dependent receptor n=2 Tax=Hymenobacter qilianensis TaxID=1385715 RepID=A0A7H0GZN9_9BACT|nr:TonB-dependent receptor [Hymenobacter qilianensis]QNP53755.1 TonB-dependent receptor [Hymenobacter qilianensis]GGF53317.1 TonB-dependent receptor [Hymenobacter qilianensis]
MGNICSKKAFLALFLTVFTLTVGLAQNGILKGTIKDATTQEGVIGGTVRLAGTTLAEQTNVDGSFILSNVPAGTYTVIITSVSYKNREIPQVVVKAGETATVNSTLEEDTKQLGEVVVRGVRRTNTEVSVISEIREATQVVSGISSEQIVKTQDRDAAEVVRRIPGVTIIDNRFIQVRGLSERYNSVWLNDVTAPSSETDKKSFSFDIVPSALLDRVLVFKDPSPELPGDFAGGLVKVYLRKPVLNERLLTVNYSGGYRNGTTGNTFYTDKGSNTDWLGFGAWQRELPGGFPVLGSAYQQYERDFYAKQLDNTFPIFKTQAMPDVRFNASYLDQINIGGLEIGSISSLNYTNTFTNYSIDRNVYDASGERTDRLRDDQSTNNVRLGAVQNFSLMLDNGDKLEFRNLFNQFGRNQLTTRDGYDNEGTQVRKSYAMGYQGRTTYTGQLAGTHSFNDEKTSLEWVGGYGYSSRNEPDLRRVAYSVQPAGNAEGREPVETVLTPAAGQVDVNNAGRLFQKLNEDIYTVNVNGKHKLTVGEREVELGAGTYIEYRDRNFEARAFGYSLNSTATDQTIRNQNIGNIFAPQNIASGGFRVDEDINSTYQYGASNELEAGYLSVNVPVTPKIKLLTGARFERNVQKIETGLNGQPVNQNYTTNFLLPSANLSYNFSETSLVRTSYGRSLNRPEFRESAPFFYYDFDFNVLNYGSLYLSPESPLKVATIDNVDLRYEFYPSEGELIHVGAFYKNFRNPIENIVVATSNLAYSFANAPSAYAYGLELDIKKNLNFLDEAFNTQAFANLTAVFNASLIKSEVKLGSDVVAWDRNRALQGQSPYVVNTGLYYQTPDNTWQMAALYNVFGPRILFAGSDQYPDVVEMPRHTVDLTLTKSISKNWSLNAGIQDVFNQRVNLLQDFNRDKKYEVDTDPSLSSYRRGAYYTVGMRFTLDGKAPRTPLP